MRCLLAFTLLLNTALYGNTQDLRAAFEAHESVTETIIVYPEEVWEAALVAAGRSEAIVQVYKIQERSSKAFQNAILTYPRLEQEKIWNILRYPELVRDLVEAGRSAKGNWRCIVQNYPEDVQNDALEIASKRYTVLKASYEIQEDFMEEYRELMQEYPRSVHNAMDALLEHPEVLSLLAEHLELTTLVGAAYKRNPDKVMMEARAYHMRVAKKLARARRDWEEDLKSDPEAFRDLKQAAQLYADEHGLREEVPPGRVKHICYHMRPYPFWCGTPHWFVETHWYPYPAWYHWGFHVNSNGAAVFINLPSMQFALWNFNKAKCYPHLSRAFQRHQKSHRAVNSYAYEGTRRFVSESRPKATSSWLKHHKRRPQANTKQERKSGRQVGTRKFG